MAGWHPISTAPKDGSLVLLFGRHARPLYQGLARRGPGDPWWDIGLYTLEGNWWTQHGYPTYSAPTHWMPLPEPPRLPAGSP
jgi:hypothetical protein